jgi:hypothetical protein
MKYTCNNKINQVNDRHYKLKYLSNMHKGLGCGGWEKEIQSFAKQQPPLLSNNFSLISLYNS